MFSSSFGGYSTAAILGRGGAPVVAPVEDSQLGARDDSEVIRAEEESR
jgi:hypothetical protein